MVYGVANTTYHNATSSDVAVPANGRSVYYSADEESAFFLVLLFRRLKHCKLISVKSAHISMSLGGSRSFPSSKSIKAPR